MKLTATTLNGMPHISDIDEETEKNIKFTAVQAKGLSEVYAWRKAGFLLWRLCSHFALWYVCDLLPI